MTNTLQIKLLSENATMPKREHDTDAGFDIYAAETVVLEPQEKALIATDIAVNIPKGYVGLAESKEEALRKYKRELLINSFRLASKGVRDFRNKFRGTE